MVELIYNFHYLLFLYFSVYYTNQSFDLPKDYFIIIIDYYYQIDS